MNLKSIASFISLLIYTVASSQVTQEDSLYKCMAHWKKGEEKVLLIKREKEKSESGNAEPPFTFSYEAFVTVLDSTAEGYRMQWVFHLPEDVKKATPGLAEAMPVYEGLKMIFTTDKMGVFEDLVNWQEVRDAYIKMMEKSLPDNLDDTAKAAIKRSEELFNSKEMVESALIKEIQIYYSPYGAVFTITGTSHQTTLSNPFFNEPLPAIVSGKIIELAPKLDYTKITIAEKIDMENAYKSIEGLLKKMNIAEDSVMVKAKDLLSELEVKKNYEYLIIQSTGWIRRVSYKDTSKMAETISTDSFLIELK